MYILSMTILIFFAVIGLCAFIAGVVDLCCHGNRSLTLVVADLNAENAEAKVRTAAHLYREAKGGRLLCVCGNDDPACDICHLLQKDYPFLEIVSPEDICIP